MMRLHTQYLTDQQDDALRALKEQTGTNASEVLRRMVDYCLKETNLNELFPALSGHLTVPARH